MFILRKFSGERKLESNQMIGEDYVFIHREYNPEDFREAFKKFFNKNHVADGDPESDEFTKKCYAFISVGPTDVTEGIKNGFLVPLYKGQQTYMMTETGKTFANLTYK